MALLKHRIDIFDFEDAERERIWAEARAAFDRAGGTAEQWEFMRPEIAVPQCSHIAPKDPETVLNTLVAAMIACLGVPGGFDWLYECWHTHIGTRQLFRPAGLPAAAFNPHPDIPGPPDPVEPPRLPGWFVTGNDDAP